MSARYSHKAGYTVGRRTTRRQTVRTVQRRVRFGPTTAKFIGLAVLAILGIFVLAGSSGRATNAYSKSQVNQELSQKKQDISDLQLEVERAKTLQSVQQTAVGSQLTPVDKVGYVPAGDVEKGSVAGVSTARP